VKRWFGLATVALSLLIAGCFSRPAFAKDEPKWIEVHSAHFSVLTDAGDKRGRKLLCGWNRCVRFSDNCC